MLSTCSKIEKDLDVIIVSLTFSNENVYVTLGNKII